MQQTKVIFKQTITRKVGDLVAVVRVEETLIDIKDIYIHPDGTVSSWHREIDGKFIGSTVGVKPENLELRIL